MNKKYFYHKKSELSHYSYFYTIRKYWFRSFFGEKNKFVRNALRMSFGNLKTIREKRLRRKCGISTATATLYKPTIIKFMNWVY